jgi:hypothetical protein
VIVHDEFEGVRGTVDSGHFSSLLLDVSLDEVLGEHTTSSQEVVILLESVQSGAEIRRSLSDLVSLLVGQFVDINIHGFSRRGLLMNTVETGHEASSEGQVWVGKSVWTSEFHSLVLRDTGVIHGNTDRSRTISFGIGQVHWGFKTRNKSLVAVGRGVGEGAKSRSVVQNSSNIVKSEFGEVDVFAVGVPEKRLSILPERLVNVHSSSIVSPDGFGHKSNCLVVLQSNVFDTVLVDLKSISCLDHGESSETEFRLTNSNFVMMLLNGDTAFGHGKQHFTSNV